MWFWGGRRRTRPSQSRRLAPCRRPSALACCRSASPAARLPSAFRARRGARGDCCRVRSRGSTRGGWKTAAFFETSVLEFLAAWCSWLCCSQCSSRSRRSLRASKLRASCGTMAFPHTSHLTPTPHTSIQPKYMGQVRFRLGVRCDEMNLHTSAKSHLAPHTHTPHLEFFVRAHGTRYNPHLTPQKLMVTSWYGSYICPPQYMVPAYMGSGTTAGCDV